MRKIGLAVLGILLLSVVLSGCVRVEKQDGSGKEELSEKIPVVNAYHKGEEIWFIHTDVSSAEVAERLTNMIGYRVFYVPRNAQVVDFSKLAKFYVFTNGVDHRDAKPWGGGPFGFQIDIFDSVPGDDGYTSLRSPYLVTWVEHSRPRILKSVQELLEAEAAGEVKIEETDFVVNVPVVRWSGGGAKI